MWKYFDPEETIAIRTLESGEIQSCLASTLPEGTEIAAYVAPPPVPPTEVSMAQAREALIDAGLIASVEAAINAMPEPARAKARNSWEYRATVRRDSELTLSLASALGLTSQEVDELFIQAATL